MFQRCVNFPCFTPFPLFTPFPPFIPSFLPFLLFSHPPPPFVQIFFDSPSNPHHLTFTNPPSNLHLIPTTIQPTYHYSCCRSGRTRSVRWTVRQACCKRMWTRTASRTSCLERGTASASRPESSAPMTTSTPSTLMFVVGGFWGNRGGWSHKHTNTHTHTHTQTHKYTGVQEEGQPHSNTNAHASHRHRPVEAGA